MRSTAKNLPLAITVALLSTSVFSTANAQIDSNWVGPDGGSWNSAANWNPMQIPNGNFDVTIDNGNAAMLDITASIQSLDIGNTSGLDILQLRVLRFGGNSLHNDGIVTLNSVGNNSASIQFNTVNSVIAGNGEIRLDGSNSSDRLLSAAGQVTHSAGHTIRGSGSLQLPLLNEGLIVADVNAAGGAELQLVANMTNNGLITTENGANFRIFSSVSIDNTNGIIRAADGNIDLGGANVIGGILESLSGSTLTSSGNTRLTNATLTTGTLLGLDAGNAILIDGGSLVNEGQIVVDLDGTTSSKTLRFETDTLLTGNGEIVLNGTNVGDRIETLANATLTLSADHTISGVGLMRTAMINNGIVEADVSSSGFDIMSFRFEDIVNNNIMRARNSAILEFQNITVDNSNGRLIADDDSRVDLFNCTVIGGTLESTATSEIRVPQNTVVLDEVHLTDGSTLSLDRQVAATLTGGTFQNDGFVLVNNEGTFSTNIQVNEDLTIEGNGEMFFNGEDRFTRIGIAEGFTITNTPEHTMRFGIGSIWGDVRNEGTIIVDDSLEVRNTAANIATDLDLPGGTLAGGGTVDAAAVNNTSGVVSPGNSAGTLTIDGDYNQSNGSALQIELGGLDSGVDSDLLVVTGNASLGGALVLQSTNGFIPDPGDSITILTADSISGEFVRILPAQEFCNLGFTITYTATTVEVTVFDAVSTDEFSFFNGTLIGGTLNDLIDSDDSRVRARSEFGFLSSEPNVLELRAGFTTVASPNELTIIFEGRVNNPNASVRVRMRNWDTNSFNQVDAFTMPTPNVDVRRLITGIPADDFIRSSDGKMEVAVRQVVIATFSLSGFISSFDQLQVCGSG